MKVKAIFHIYECKINNGCTFLNGRLLHDLSMTDELILLKKIGIQYYNQNYESDGILNINDVDYEMIKINKIISYGKSWNFLPSGMSAQIECDCEIEGTGDLLLCKIV